MMYLDKAYNRLINLDRFDAVKVEAIAKGLCDKSFLVAERIEQGKSERVIEIKTEYVLAVFDTEAEAIAELKYIAQEMNK